MYKEYFGFNDIPFSIAPDPRYLYLSEQHKDALAHLLYGVGEHGGFVLLTGEVGTGKTTICRSLLQQMPSDCEVAYVVNPRQSEVELLRSICDELGVYYFYEGQGSAYLVDLINEHLLEAHSRGTNTVLIIDEAQNLSVEVLEQLRLLTNLETDQKKLLQLILLGQPELNAKLAREELRQMAQRITARYHLKPLTFEETQFYIQHRLQVAGSQVPLFGDEVIKLIHREAKGIPRLINVICDRCLLGAYSANQTHVERATAKAAIAVVQGEVPAANKPPAQWRQLGMGVALMTLLAALYYLLGGDSVPKLQKAPQNPVATATVPVVDGAAEQVLALQRVAQSVGLDPLGVKSTEDFCRAIQKQQWRCTQSRGLFVDVLKLARPVAVAIRQVDGSARWALLNVLGADKVVVRYAQGERRELDAQAISATWPSEFLWLWKPPPGYRAEVSIGESDAFVQWLHAVLPEPLAVKTDIADDEQLDRSRILSRKASGLNGPAVVDLALLGRLLTAKESMAITEPGLPAEFIVQLAKRQPVAEGH
jgi:general secretion pathway protein A